MFYDYVDGGSWTETTYRANEADFARLKFRQRVAVDIGSRSTRAAMLGQEVAMPVVIAPTGLTGMQHADGEISEAPFGGMKDSGYGYESGEEGLESYLHTKTVHRTYR